MATRDQILGVKIKTDTVNVPDLGAVKVRELISAEVVEYSHRRQTAGAKPAVAYLIRTAAQDDAGGELFTDGDLIALGELGHTVTGPIADAVLSLSGVTGPKA